MILCKVMTAKKNDVYLYMNDDGTYRVEVYRGKKTKKMLNLNYWHQRVDEKFAWAEMQAEVNRDCLVGLDDM